MRKPFYGLLVFLMVTSLLLSVAACSQEADENNEPVTVSFTFDEDEEHWTGGFTDLPIDHEKHGYDVGFHHAGIPVEGQEGGGLFLTGNNHSDDLFMYVTRCLGNEDGLKPNTTYQIGLWFDLATNVAPGMVGIGGSPGESVYIKAGVVSREPEVREGAADRQGYYVLNLDKGNQSRSGEDMTVLGNAAKEEGGVGALDDSFQYKHFEGSFRVMTGQEGQLWVVIGTDSGFEGISQLYFDNVSVTFTPVVEGE